MKVINVMTHEALDAAKWCRDYLGVRFEDDNLFFSAATAASAP